MDKFEWDQVDEIVPQQLKTAAYTNPNGDLVIRQGADQYRDEDSVIIVSKRYVRKLIQKLEEIAKDMQI